MSRRKLSPIQPYLKAMGANIRLARKRNLLRQVDLADKSGVAYRHLQDIEAGKVNVTVETLIRLAQTLHCTPAFFLS